MKTSKKYPLNYSIGFVRMILTIKLKGYAEKVEYKESSTDSFVLTFSEHEADIELFAANGGTDLIISAEEGKKPSADEIYSKLLKCGLELEKERSVQPSAQVAQQRSNAYQYQKRNYGSGNNYPGRTNGIAIAGFVLSLLGSGLLGLIFSFIGLQKSWVTGTGRGLAIAGIVISLVYIGLVLFLFMFIGCASKLVDYAAALA